MAQLMADLMKTQMLMNLTSKDTPLRNFFMFQAYEKFMQYLPAMIPKINAFCFSQRRKYTPAILQESKEVKSTISCERMFQSQSGKSSVSNHSRMDSVINYITTIPAIKNLLCLSHTDYLPHDFAPIQIETDIFFELTDLMHAEGIIENLKFKLFCYEHDIQHLQQFIEKCNTEYERRMANKLGTSLYYFDMMVQSKNKRSNQNPLPTSHLLYNRHKFHTSRTFDNVFFEQSDSVRNHVDFFLTQKGWYEKKGIPYTLGFMFHGAPGCGKTSSIKAIANTARRHIINIHLSEIKSKEQLTHLFFNDEINVYDGFKTEKFIIPIHERLFVIEDIDAMGDAVLRREWKKPDVEKLKKETSDDPWVRAKESEDEKDPIDLSFLLNLLDGTLEASGRIIAISSNHPERIDRALIRPGRIDMIVEFKKCNRQILQKMMDSFYDKEFPDWTTDDVAYRWSPAEVNQILFRNFKSPETAIQELLSLQPHELSGIREE